MSGETEKDVSGWTTDTLLSHMKQMMEANDRRYTERFAAQEAANASALAAAEKAVLKAEVAADRRFESVNEFRQTLADQTAGFVTRVEYGAQHKALEDRVAAVDSKMVEALTHVDSRFGGVNSRLDLTAGKNTGLNAAWVFLIGFISLAATIIAIVVAFSR